MIEKQRNLSIYTETGKDKNAQKTIMSRNKGGEKETKKHEWIDH